MLESSCSSRHPSGSLPWPSGVPNLWGKHKPDKLNSCSLHREHLQGWHAANFTAPTPSALAVASLQTTFTKQPCTGACSTSGSCKCRQVQCCSSLGSVPPSSFTASPQDHMVARALSSLWPWQTLCRGEPDKPPCCCLGVQPRTLAPYCAAAEQATPNIGLGWRWKQAISVL